MKTRILIPILYTLITTVSITAQNNVYTLDLLHTKRKLKKVKYSPKIYSVIYKDVVDVYGGIKKQIINNEYLELELELEALKEQKETEELEESYNQNRITEINSISTSINNFLQSKETFSNKEHWLIDAQLISDYYDFDFLIFSNEEINPDRYSKFKLLKFNDLDLKVHLKRIVWEMEKLNLKKSENNSMLSSKIDSLETKLFSTDKYYISKSKKITKKRKSEFVGKLINVESNTFEGEFYVVDFCYTVKNDFRNNNELLKKGELIRSKKVISKSIDKKQLSNSKILFKKKGKNNLYISDSSFLKKYAFLINGKFNKENTSLVLNK